MTTFRFLLFFAALLILSACTQHKSFEPPKRVLLIGIDGMSTDGFQLAQTPFLDSLVRNGVLSMKTRGVMPTVSGPSWGSILLGAGPEQHGITSNGWTTENRTILPTVSDEQGYFPSIFTVLKQQFPHLKLGMIYDWKSLNNFFNPKDLDSLIYVEGYHDLGVVDAAKSYLLREQPDFSFLYIGSPDETGHASGFNSKAYHESLEAVDSKLSQLFHSLLNAGLLQDMVVIVVTDHGGIGKGHGGEQMIEIQIPWIISGKGIRKNVMLEQPNDLFNTASTVLNLFGGKQPECWIGLPAFGSYEAFASDYPENNKTYQPYPEFSLKPGYYYETQKLEIFGEGVRYTLDDSEPDSNAFTYDGPITIDQSMTVKAKSFHNKTVSLTNSLKLYLLNRYESILLEKQANKKYPGAGVASLLDSEYAAMSYADKNWLGFQGDDLVLYLELKEEETLSNLSISFLKNEPNWIFAPKTVKLYTSKNGRNYRKTASKRFSRNLLETGKNEAVLEFSAIKTKFVKVVIINQEIIPDGHRGKGDQAWLFVDEIEID